MDNKEPKEEYPSICLAYDIALRSYDVLFERITAFNNKIQTLMSVSCSVTFAAVIAGKALELNMKSVWLVLILTVFALTIYVSLHALFRVKKGNLITLDPKILFESYSDLSTREFKRAITEHAGGHFEHNSALLLNKWKCANRISALILIEVVLFVLWVSFLG